MINTPWLQRFSRKAVLILSLLMTAVGAKAADYVFMYNGYFLGQNTTPTTSFVPNASIYSGTSGSTFRNGNNYYIRYNNGLTFSTTNSTNLYIYNNYLVYAQYGEQYISYGYFNPLNMNNPNNNTRAWRMSNNNSNQAITYTVTTNSVPSSISDFTINSGSSYLSATGSYNYGHSNTTYTPAHTHYSFNSLNYYSTDASQAASTTAPNATEVTTGYTWSLTGGGSYASVNSSTGAITVGSLPTIDTEMTLTCSVTSNGVTKTASKTIILQSNTVYEPTITRSGNNITLETTSVGATIYYTTDGSTPSASNGTAYTGPFSIENLTFPVTIQAIAIRNGTNSTIASETYSTPSCETPTISITSAGAVTITSLTEGSTIRYTTNGTDPTPTSGTVYNGTFNVSNLATVKAIAYKDGYTASEVAEEQYITSGTTTGGQVILNDREDHKWSYYSDPECPVRSLSPADVKITYYGDGIVMTGNNDYTASSTDFVKPGETNYTGGAKVNVGGENENTFIYYKTLERGDATQTAWTFSSGNQSSAASRCPYTPIPNPFQVRPTYGARGSTDANNFTGWRGFQCWRLKSVTGGAVYAASSGGTALSTGAVINAETEIYFAPNGEYGMEVELEAVWARAYLVKGNNGNANAILNYGNLGVERNFMTLTANENYRFNGTSGRRITNVDRAVTISCYYPSGEAPDNTGGVVTGNNNNITLGANTKFENVTLSAAAYTLTTSGHDVIVGRGCTSTNVGTVRGMSDGSSSAVDYTIRLESGTYGTFALIDNTARTFSSTVSTKAIFGSDYDRAKSDNNKLSIAANNTIYGGNAVHVFSSSSNRNNLTYDWLIKSGKVQGSKSVTDANADESIYIGNSGNNDNTQYMGKRRFIMEGGEIASLAGSLNSYGNNRNTYMVNDGDAVEIRIKGGTIRGSVYGAAAYASATGNRRFVFTGGDVRGWIAGGANGTQSDGGYLYGSTKIYIGGKTNVNSNSSTSVINRAVGGNVFGAGCGYGAGSNSGQVTEGTSVVVADEAYVERGVYGGGSYGYTTSTANVFILGGTIDAKAGGVNGTNYLAAIDGGVYGGACQNQGGTVNLTMKGGTVNGSVYGGSNYTGTLSGTSTVILRGGKIVGSLYGGGNGKGGATNVSSAVAVKVYGGTVTDAVYGCNNVNGAPQSTVTVDIYGTDPAPSANSYALGSVFGGGNQANYNGTPVVTVHNCDNSIEYVYGGGNAAAVAATNVTIWGGNKIGNVFGGGNGTVTAANVTGNTSVNIYGGTIGSVFGGSNSQGTIGGTITVNVAKQAGDTDPDGSATACAMHIDEVYGGGNMAASQAGSITIGCTGDQGEGIGDVYGGANQANITGNIALNITGGSINRVFGGNNTSGNINGTIQVDVNWATTNPCGYNYLGSVFGGGNLATYTGSPAVNILNGTVSGNVYGGGAGNLVDGANRGVAGKVTGNPAVTIGDSDATHTAIVLGDVYGGGDAADVAGTPVIVVNDCNTEIGYLYGGGNAADVNGTNITVNGGTIHHDAFGGGHGDKNASNPSKYADVKGNVVFNVYGGTFDRVFAGSNSKGDITGTSALTINKTGTCDMKIREVYGGGNEAAGNAGSVTIGCTGAIVTGDAGHAAHPDNIGTTLEGIGTVYGGANAADIGKDGSPSNITLNINSGMVNNVFGGNNTSGTIYGTIAVNINKNAATCGWYVGNVFGGGNLASYSGTPTVTLTNGTISHSVYGGGNEAGVGGSLVNINGGAVVDGIYGGCNTSGDVSGNIVVNINGGTLGTSTTRMTNGIFGGGFGQNTTTSGNVTVNVGDATHTPTIYADVYGGSALGNVNSGLEDYTRVNLNAGTIYGDAYGGGLGQLANTSANPQVPAIAALVNGNVTVTQNGVRFIPGYATEVNPDNTQIVNAGRIFGCNNLNGSPQGTVLVLVNKTSDNPTIGTYDMQAVYGGGNLAAYAPAAATMASTTVGQFTTYQDKNGNDATHNAAGKPLQVVINGCTNASIEYVYGGGNAAPTPSTDVLILGAKEIGYVFGGGNGKDRVLKNGTWGINPGADVGINDNTLYGSGDANTTIFGGTIHEAYGASNQKGTIKGDINLNVEQDVVSCPLAIDKIVGAGKNADVDGDCILVMGCMPSNPKTAEVFGGADNANVNGNVELTITSGTFGKVFGGNNLGGIIKGHIKVNIEETGCNPIKIDELYLGGNQAAYSRFGYYDTGTTDGFGRPIYQARTDENDSHTAVTNPAADATHTFPYAEPVLNVISCTYIGKVFGGGLGNGAAMYANPTVNINMIQGDFANNATVGVPAKMTELSLNSSDNPNNLGVLVDVYGGGNEAAVYGNTTVNVGTAIGQSIDLTSTNTSANVVGAFVSGTVYGAGKGVVTDPNAAIVTGNTQVNMAGGHVSRSIYGGGELGSVGTFTETYTTQESHPYHAVGEPKTCKSGTGLTEVLISGGQVGLVNQLMPDPSRPTSDDDYGYVFCASKGVADSLTYTNANLLAVSGSSHLEISGTALIAASVYGGSENGQVLGDTHVEIKGGQIGSGYYKDGSNVDHWDAPYTETQWTTAIDKIKAGTFTDNDAAPFHECDAWPFGPEGNRHVYDYFHGTAGYDSKGGGKPGSDGHSYYGHVFGGGSGYYPFAPGKWRRTAGRVNGNTLVEITGGHILTNVYGGNEITDVLGSSKVHMTGGTVGVPRTLAGIQARPVNSYIFGAGMGDPRVLFNGWSNVGSAEVIVEGNAVVFGSVFGGGEDGHILGNVSTTIKGNAVIGTFGSSGVDGNIFGSGRGFSALALTAGTVCGNVTVNIAENAKILGSIFGGGRMAAVGTYLAEEGTANYGAMQPGTAHGNVTVNITGGTIGNQSQMATSQYSIGDVFGGSKGTLMNDWAKSQKLGLVKNTTVNISQATGYTTTIYGNVYGGGEIASVGYYSYATQAQADAFNTTHPTEPMAEGDVNGVLEDNTGLATILITGGTIGQATSSDTKGHVFGGCLGRAGEGYSGYSFVNNSDVTLQGGTVYGSIFGGGENGHVMHNTDVKIKSGTVGIALDKTNLPDASLNNSIVYKGNVYGGGRGIDTYNNNGTDTYSITAGKVGGNTNVTVEGGTVYRNVYGGGSLASVGIRDEDTTTDGLATVTIKGGQIGTDGGASANNYNTLIPDRENRRENGFVFGSGRGMSAGANSSSNLVDLAYTKNTEVYIQGTANVTGSVFGGGENGHVKKNTKVYVKENCFVGTELVDAEHVIDDDGRGRLIYRGNVYGGGRGIDEGGDNKLSLTAGRVFGNTFVEISGGKIYHDVFGGGSLASVGNETVNATTGEVTYGNSSGQTEVHIKGGIIGYSSNTAKQGFNCGFVYGGCRGLSADPSSEIIKMAYVHESKVYIEPGADVKGSVFGGGANGHVKNDTYVSISGGSVGTALTAAEAVLDDHGVAPVSVFHGNVYAGGRGVDMFQVQQQGATAERYSMSAGAVYGNAELLMTGGHVWHNIYGSGAMASVGTVEAKTAGTHVHDEIVDGNGDLVDNTQYNPDESEINYLTGVFKANTGKVTLTITGGTVGDTTPGQEGINNGNVFGAGRGVSASRSDYVASMEFVNETEVTIGTSGQTSYTGSTPGELNYPFIYGNVYGGGENGHVKTDTDVKIHSGIIGWPLVEGTNGMYKTEADGSSKNPYRGHVFGGGCGVDPLYHGSTETRSSTAGRVYGHTNVTMTGGVVRRAIYGGGLLASVGVYQLLQSDMHITDMIEDEVDAGDATVTISGGYIGNVNPDGTALSGTGYLVLGDNNGHVFGSSCGMVADNYVDPNTGQTVDVQYRQMGYTHSTHVSISGGHLFGSVFGSGENGHVWEDATINISGGEIGSESNSSTFIYAGNVYGSGRGVDHPHAQISETAGKVRGNTTVNVTGGTIWRDVYGGGSLASVGEKDEAASDSKKNVTTDPLTNNPFPYSTGLTRVVIDGSSTVRGSVYGSGRGVASTNAEYIQAAYVKNTLVTVKGNAHVYNNVFGGGNAGHLRKNTDVTIDEQAKVDGSVYGGGAGSIESPTAGLVSHDVTVNIKGGIIAKDVYGGGAIANTNVHDVRNTASTDCSDTNRGKAKTDVNLTGGIILGDAYGGGQGVIPASTATAAEIANAGAIVFGDVTVTLNGTAFKLDTTNDDQGNSVASSGRVFGCNNLNGTPKGTVLVHVKQTKGVTESAGTYTVNNTKPTKGTDTYELEAVYGGGNLAAYEPYDPTVAGQYNEDVSPTGYPLQVVIEGCDLTSINYVYGGGNAATVPSSQAIVKGAYEIGTVFGGGNGKDRISTDGQNYDENPGAHVGYKADGTTSAGGNGNANAYLYGGTIHHAFGGSNTKGNIRGKAELHIDELKNNGTPVCPLLLDEVYGGGNVAYMEGGTDIDLGCVTYLKAIYGGARNANVGGNITLTITSGHFDRVFGGNNEGGTINGSITVNIEETGCNPITIGELYGCGNMAPYTKAGNSEPTINIKSCTSIGRVFGGGFGSSAIVTGNPIININEVVGVNANNETWTYHQQTVNGEVVGKVIEYYDNASDPTQVTSTVTMPTHDKGKIGAIGTVFGGGNAAAVEGNTNVNIGTLQTVDYVSTPTTNITVVGVDIRGNVFGGGNKAEVSGNTNVVIGQ